MASLLQAIHECFFGVDYHEASISPEENVMDLKKSVEDIVRESGWTENIAKAILGGIENGLKQGAQMGKAMKEASGKAIDEAVDFAHDHPYFCALIAVGVLVILMPWVLEALGFAELGPVEGSFAAWWQSTYRGYVTEKSLFSYFQRLGMVWRRSVVKG